MTGKEVFGVMVLALVMLSGSLAHDVIGFIINDSPYYLDLTHSDVKHGEAHTLPAIRLAPYTYTNFTLSSPMIGVDEIDYVFGYTPETAWCADYPSPSELRASYDYSFGSNSCSGSSQSCSDGTLLQVTYNQCSTFWGTSRPTYSYQKTSYVPMRK